MSLVFLSNCSYKKVYICTIYENPGGGGAGPPAPAADAHGYRARRNAHVE